MNFIKFEKQNHVAVLTIDKPATYNALDMEMLNELTEAVAAAQEDEDIYVLVLTGAGKVFVSGADIKEMSTKTPLQARELSKKGSELFRKIELMEKPVICAVNGHALGGGCEIAMCCDIRIANEKAKFGLPEVTLGITPGFSATARLPRLIGTAKAKEWIFTGKIVTAKEAMDAGLVNAVCAPEALMEEAMKMAGQIAANSQSAVRLCKNLLNRSTETDIDTAIDFEVNTEAIAFGSPDQIEGMTAFIEKRKPNFI